MKAITIAFGMMIAAGCMGLAGYLHANAHDGWPVFVIVGLAHGIGSFICHAVDEESSKTSKLVDRPNLGRKRTKCRPVNRNKLGKSKKHIGF